MLRQIASGAFGSVHCVQRRDSKVIHAAKYVNSAGPDLDREVIHFGIIILFLEFVCYTKFQRYKISRKSIIFSLPHLVGCPSVSSQL